MERENLLPYFIARAYRIPYSRDLMIDFEGLFSQCATKFLKELDVRQTATSFCAV